MTDLKLVYAAPTEETAFTGTELFRDQWDAKYPKILQNRGMTTEQTLSTFSSIRKQ